MGLRMRAISNTFLAALIVAALFWGNCLSCPQMLLAFAHHAPSHGCCKHKTAKPECTSQKLRNFIKTDPGSVAPPQSAVAPAVPALAAMPLETGVSPLPEIFSPPDIHSVIRV
jgi:hypothetical protein